MANHFTWYHAVMYALSSDLPQRSAPAPGAATTRPLHIVFHVPRCAGQTIHRHLSRHAPKGSYLRVRKRKGPSRFLLPQYQNVETPDPRSVNAVSGHWIGRSIEQYFDDRPIARSILLRDPVSQFVSHYNFRMIRYISQGLQPYSPDIAYHSRQRNYVTHCILRTFAEMSWPRLVSLSTAERYAEADRFLSECSFVGDHTRCDELIAQLAPDVGVPAKAETRNTSGQWLQCVEWTPLKMSDLSRSMIDSIKQDNMLDQLLWENWKDADNDRAQPSLRNFAEDPLAKRAATQSSRLFNQVRRRFHRGWNAPSDLNTNVWSSCTIDPRSAG
ncbi:MAG: hypothetical protein KBT60_09780 [Methyloceanibacter sp.]|nr:hypothetical protein [Methyloceanibacter sp.]